MHVIISEFTVQEIQELFPMTTQQKSPRQTINNPLPKINNVKFYKF